jgi:mono/diheme cytochrome c family protein
MRFRLPLVISSLAALAASAVVGAYALDPDKDAAAAPFERLSEGSEHWKLLQGNCVACHNAAFKSGGIAFDALKPETVGENAEVWEKAVRKLRGRMMPPPGNPRPDEARTEAFIGWLEAYLDHSAVQHPDPGRVALHRLNRKEYANAVRDLLALDIDPAALLPQDDVSDGFDNVADVLQVSPSFLDQYISAARTLAIQAVGQRALKTSTVSLRPPAGVSQSAHIEGLPLGTRGGFLVSHAFPADGDYQLSFGGAGADVYDNPILDERFIALLDGKIIFDSAKAGAAEQSAADAAPLGTRSRGRRTNVRLHIPAGTHEIGAAYVAKSYPASLSLLAALNSRGGAAGAAISGVDIIGPYNAVGLGVSPSRDRIFICRPASTADETPCAKKIFASLARKAFRRPVTDADLEAPLRFFRDGRKRAGFETGVEQGIMAILASPKFLYRTTSAPAGLNPGAAYRLTDLDLASRLSFFLWSSLPDDELLSLAEAGRLKDPSVLEAQVRRMLADKRAGALVTNFAFQWLDVAGIDVIDPDPAIFPEFDADLRFAFKEEMRLFLESILLEDRNVVNLLTADYTYLNERLARHYGIPNITGNRYRKIHLADSSRNGLLGKGSILMFTSYPNRTAPVLRGAWILENITGTPPSPPPPNVEALSENEEGKEALSVRALMEKHRTDPSCNACHGVMDPLGFALENFDAIGAWREKDRYARTLIDSSGQLATGQQLAGVDDLRKALSAKPDQFVQTFTEKLMTFALGRTIEYHDMPTVRAIVRDAARQDYRLSAIVMNIVKSDQFQMSKAPDVAGATTKGKAPQNR